MIPVRIFRFIFLGVLISLSTLCFAQKSELHPVSMKHLDTPNNGSKAQAHIEIVFSAPLQGARVLKDSDNATPDDSYPSSATSVHAKGLAVAALGRYAKNVTIVHPDFQTSVIDFKSLGFDENVLPGEHYIIEVDVPGLPLVEANRAFDNLDFDGAKTKYEEYLASPDAIDATLARQRLAVISELAAPCNFLAASVNKTDRASLFKCMKAQQMIYDKTHSLKAYREYLDFRKKLYGNQNKVASLEDGVSELKVVNAYLNQSDTRAKSDLNLPKVDGNPFYSWIIVNVDLDDVVFDGGNQYKDAEFIEGAWRLFVPKGVESAGTITLHHPDCAPLTFALTDFGISEVAPGSVYVVDIDTPSAAIIEADRAFATLDFPTAQMLYNEILYDQYVDSTTLELAKRRYQAVTPLIYDGVKSRWDELKKTVNLKGKSVTRDEISKACLEMSNIADKLASENVPGMKRKAETYKNLASDYKTAVFMNVNAKKINDKKEVVLGKDGNPLEYAGSDIVLVFDKSKLMYDYEVPMSATSKGVFKKYLPKRVSDWLSHHPEEELNVTPMKYVWNKNGRKLQRIGDDFKVSLDRGESSFSIIQYWRE